MNGDISKIQFKHPGFEEDAKQLNFTEKQANAILEMRLYKLIGLEILALQKEYKECLKRIAEYEKVLKSRDGMNKVIKEDLDHIKEEFAEPRKTLIENGKEAVYEESAAAVAEIVFVMDRFGYCKLLDRSAYERNRETVDTEYKYVIPCLNTDKLCIFTDTGNLHQVKMMDIPSGKLRDKGTPIDNLSKYDGSKEEIVFLTNFGRLTGQLLLFATKMAMVKNRFRRKNLSQITEPWRLQSCRRETVCLPSVLWEQRRTWHYRARLVCSCVSPWRKSRN